MYARAPGDPGFAPRNGPAYESTVTIGETASPLGAPGFAFSIDAGGSVTGYANFSPAAAPPAPVACPPSGAFVLALTRAAQSVTVAVPCDPAPGSTASAAFASPPAFATAPPATPAACPSAVACVIVPPSPPAPPACPPSDAPDPVVPGLCDPLATAVPETPQNGTPPPAPSASPASAASPALCTAGAPDAAGFATCIAADPVRVTGAAITHADCGTHTPVTDPGPAFTVTVEVDQAGAVWGTYAVTLLTTKLPWLNFQSVPPAQTCGLAFSLSFRIGAIAPLSGNASVSPSVDTGNPALADEGVGSLVAPSAPAWGSDE